MRTRLLDLALLALAVAVGCGALLLFGLFLWRGPLEVVDLGLATAPALGLDAGLSLLFFLQHSGMVRRPFRVRLARLLGPRRAGAVYTVASGALLVGVVVLWQPTAPPWLVLEGAWRVAVRGVFLFALAGMAWVFLVLRDADLLGVTPLLRARRRSGRGGGSLVAKGPYAWIRHPTYALTILLLWASPAWRADRVLFAVLWTVWVVVGARLEERDLLARHGEPYATYRLRVPPWLPGRRRKR